MRLIDADELQEYFDFYEYEGRGTLVTGSISWDIISIQPTVDAVEVVRCKDCVFRDKFGYCVAPMGEVGYARVDDDDFCSCGFGKKVEHDT